MSRLVFVLTHHARAPLTMQGGTTFHFVTDGIHAALAHASARSNFTLGASDVYWSEFYGIWQVSKAGGDARRVIEDDGGYRVVGNDAQALYWSKPPAWSIPPSLFRLPLAGTSEPLRIADDASDAWTVSGSQLYYLSSSGQLRAVPAAGGLRPCSPMVVGRARRSRRTPRASTGMPMRRARMRSPS